jgi:hypothetical protein
MVIDADGQLFLLSIYNVDHKIEEKLVMKVSQIIALNPDIQTVRNIKYPSECVKNIIVRKPKNLLIDGVDLKAHLAQEKIEMKLLEN